MLADRLGNCQIVEEKSIVNDFSSLISMSDEIASNIDI